MASTRSKNTIGNYNLQQRDYKLNEQYNLYPNSQYGVAAHTMMPGNGLMPGSIPWTQLSNNYADTESFLFGINSTNLTKPRPPPFVPQITNFWGQSANIYNTSAVLVPEPFVMEKGQRPFPL